MAARNNKPEEGKQEQILPAQEVTGSEPKTSMPDYLAAALRISTSRPAGANSTDTMLLDKQRVFRGISGNPVGATRIPNIMVLDYLPTYGYSADATSALNRAVYSEFNKIRSKISGNRPYEPADHMIYRVCANALRELYAKVRSIYGITKVYSATNMYRPDAVLTALGLDAQDWIRNSANLYQWLLNHKGAMLPFPTVPLGDITDRHLAFNSVIFTDGDIEASQCYIVNQRAFYSYEFVDEVKGATLRVMPRTFAEFQTMWDEMYTALQNSSDVYIIAADIRRAFEEAVVTDLPDTPVDYAIEYSKLDSVLTSIMNANMCGDGTNIEAFKLYDGGNKGILCTPSYTVAYSAGLYERICPIQGNPGHINMIEANPDATALNCALRFKPYVEVDSVIRDNRIHQQTVTFRAFGSEVLLGARMYYFNYTGELVSTALNTTMGIQASVTNYTDVILLLRSLENFDWHPPIFIANFVEPSVAVENDAYVLSLTCHEDVQNYVPVSNTDLTNVHEANILASFGF